MGEQGQRRRSRFLERPAQVLDLPGDVVAGLPRVELVGDSELRMENHRGILAYGDEEIRISGGAFMIRITGQDMQNDVIDHALIPCHHRFISVTLSREDRADQRAVRIFAVFCYVHGATSFLEK